MTESSSRSACAKLCAGVAVIKVGATTVVEMQEKKQRIENALHAARSAVAEGMVPGGGAAYINAIPAVRAFANTLSGDMKTGAGIVLKALTEPARQIAENAGMDGGAVVAEILRRPAGTGFDAATGEYANMLEAGIVDSAKVTRLALLNAASLVRRSPDHRGRGVGRQGIKLREAVAGRVRCRGQGLA